MRKKSTRFLSAALAACMMVSALPVGAFAAEPGTETENGVSAQADAAVPEGYIAINETNFPDPNFRDYMARNWDQNNDKYFSPSEIAAAKWITCDNLWEGQPIKSLKGIEYFTEIWELTCVYNDLTEIDLSHNTKLEYLNCHHNKLEKLDVSGLPLLKTFYCGQNKLQSIDVSKNKQLKDFSCKENPLNTLEVSQNTELEELDCVGNNLTELDVSENKKLKELWCYTNKLSNLDLRNQTELEVLGCRENPLSVLSISANTKLKKLYVNKTNLTSLDATNNTALEEFNGKDCTYNIAVEGDGKFDLTTLPGNFDASRATATGNGTIDGNILTVDPNSKTFRYDYDIGQNQKLNVVLNVHWHNYQWQHDDTKHWKMCTTANCPGLTADQEAKGLHTFASAKDAACADGCGYTRPLYTVTVKNATAILGDEELNAPVAAGTKVTLTADTTPEDKELHGWKLYKVAADGTETEITDTTGLLSGSVHVVTLTVPAYNVKAVPDYADILYDVNPVKCTVTLNNVEVPTAAKGDVITATPNEQGPGKKFTGWTVTKTVNGVEVDITDELRDVSQNGLTIAELTMPGANVTIEALFDDDSQLPEPDPDQPVVTDDGSGDIVAGVVIGGIAAVGAYEVGTGLYRITQMDDVAMPTNRIALAKLMWERAGKPEPESTALYSDISAEDTDAQKAARWAVEQELLKDDTNEDEQKFHPAFPVSKLRVCLTWEKAKQKGLFDQNTEA